MNLKLTARQRITLLAAYDEAIESQLGLLDAYRKPYNQPGYINQREVRIITARLKRWRKMRTKIKELKE